MDAEQRQTNPASGRSGAGTRAARVRRKRTPTSYHLRGLGLGALLWIACCGPGARAAGAQENADALASRALFDEARRLMSAGQFAAACPKLEESQRLRAGIGTQFNLAECYEKLGRFASAWSLYLHVAADTKASGQPEREQVARERARALEGRVAYLLLQVAEPVAGLELSLDGNTLGAALWGVPTPIDPGEHALVARAPGHAAWQGVAQIPEHAARISVEIPRLAPAAAAPLATAATQPPASTPATTDAPVTPDHRLQYAIGGVGLGLVALSGVFGLAFLHDNDQAKKICSADASACAQADIEHHAALLSSAREARKAGFSTLALGLVGVGISAAWLLQTPHEASGATARVALRGQLGPSEARLGCSVAF